MCNALVCVYIDKCAVEDDFHWKSKSRGPPPGFQTILRVSRYRSLFLSISLSSLTGRGLAEIQLYERLMTNFRRWSNDPPTRLNHRRHLGGVIIVLLQFNTWVLQYCG